VDGILVVPQNTAAEVFTQALEKARGEKLVRQAIEDGMSACEAFATFGIM
jgi:4-hydroxy-4-methyl-2-oxoglutarate aldolase